MAYTKYSLTPANNTAAPPDGAPEGMLPSAVNDTMRDMMAQIRDVGDGIRGGTYTMTAAVITGGTITGITDLAVADGGTGASTAANARTNLLAVGFTATTGSATIPSGTTGQRDASPSSGFFRFNSTVGKFEGYNGTAWGSVGGGATGAGGDEVFVENGTTVTTSYTLSTNKNAVSVGAITINSGAVVTVPSGARWVVL
jgi:hypothetical protein